METLVVRIPASLAASLDEEAARLNLTKSEVARRRLAAPLSVQPPSGFDLVADLVGKIESGPSDMSTRKKDYLRSTGYGKPKGPR
ncbi:MAG TPA: hypothetical protein VMN36_01015 [Verrucomicrobiales bacterium]|nr:hypothetical protein [Verrucomicrobiales bacterium]